MKHTIKTLIIFLGIILLIALLILCLNFAPALIPALMGIMFVVVLWQFSSEMARYYFRKF